MKYYLNDGVFAEVTDEGLELTTSNGLQITNRIIINSDTWDLLLHLLHSRKQRVSEEA